MTARSLPTGRGRARVVSRIGELLPCDRLTAEIHGRLEHQLRTKGRPIPDNDLWMAAMGSRHAACVDRLTRIFSRVVEDRAIVRVQGPVRLSDRSEPEPDIALLVPRDDFYAERHPEPDDVVLLVEVADASRQFDRTVKLPLYASAGVPDVWLVDLEAGAVEVYREPERRTETGGRAETGYRDSRRLREDETLRLPALGGVEVPVSEVLPG